MKEEYYLNKNIIESAHIISKEEKVATVIEN